MEERTLDQEGWVHGIHLESRTQALWDWSKRETQERKEEVELARTGEEKMKWKQPDSSEENVLTSSHPAVFSNCLCKANFSSYRNNCTYRIPKYFLEMTLPAIHSRAGLGCPPRDLVLKGRGFSVHTLPCDPPHWHLQTGSVSHVNCDWFLSSWTTVSIAPAPASPSEPQRPCKDHCSEDSPPTTAEVEEEAIPKHHHRSVKIAMKPWEV